MPGPNDLLRAARKRTASAALPTESMSRRELAEAVNAWLWRTTGKRYSLDAHTIARYERGSVRWPGAHYRAALRHVLGVATDAELGFRAMSAPLPVDVAASTVASSSDEHVVETDWQVRALPGPAGRPGALRFATALVEGLHRDYQAARYAEVAAALPGVTDTVTGLVEGTIRDRHRQALSLRCQAAVVEAKLATKFGDGITAYRAAERARAAVEEGEDTFGQVAAAYQLVCALPHLGGADEAERHAASVAGAITEEDPTGWTWRGMLTLMGAVIAARRADRVEAHGRLVEAERLATCLGRDGNIGFTAFGPTNVQIHRIAVAVATDDPRAVLAVGLALDVEALSPGLHGRRGQFHLDNAWAHARLREDPLAVIHLLEAERVAPQFLRSQRTAHTVVGQLPARERRHAVPGLRGLADRMGVSA
ncbi:hypothetical protein [Saccharothrix syringae]|uniref:XRE family transcriptional regulator n=1 Tax=Saccharothrix syringae TaxID=103733 RepID=A0A5Q0GYT1_SACSY|nr:hypothetical protein [Saccharothrix syringae]QFZ18674.1 XRE family transcriptional regulator [Saccharothrix syringae]